MDEDKFAYDGWEIERKEDGSVTIMSSEQKEQSASRDFSQSATQPLFIPQPDVARLVTYLLTGQSDNTEVLHQIENLGRVGSTV